MSFLHSAGRTVFRAANQVLNPLGVLLSTPGVIHGSPAFSGATTLFRRCWAFGDLFDRIENVEGDIVEAGVHWGYGILCFLHLTRNAPRKVYGFDSFGGHSDPIGKDRSGGRFVAMGSSFAVSQDNVWRTLELGTGLSRAELGDRVELRAGWMNETMPVFDKDARDRRIKIAFIHLDPDLYEPCRDTLTHCWQHLQPGGLVLCGQLKNDDTAGKGHAVREFLATLDPAEYTLEIIKIRDVDGRSTESSVIVKR